MPVSLKTYQRVSFCFWNDFLARETRNAAEFARADPGMVPEETGEMSRLGKAEFGADGVKRLRAVEHEIDGALHPQHVHVDFRRSTDGSFEQAEEMRPRQSGRFRQHADIDIAGDVGTNGFRDPADALLNLCRICIARFCIEGVDTGRAGLVGI